MAAAAAAIINNNNALEDENSLAAFLHNCFHNERSCSPYHGKNLYGLILLPENQRRLCVCGTAVVDGVILAYQISDLIDIVLRCDLDDPKSVEETGEVLLRLFRKSTYCLPRSQQVGNINGDSTCTINKLPVYNFLCFLLKDLLTKNTTYDYPILHALARIAEGSASGVAAVQLLHDGCATLAAVYKEIYVCAKYTRSRPHRRVDNIGSIDQPPYNPLHVVEGRLFVHPLEVSRHEPGRIPSSSIAPIVTSKAMNSKCIGFFYHNRMSYSLCFGNNTYARLLETSVRHASSAANAHLASCAMALYKINGGGAAASAAAAETMRYPMEIFSLFKKKEHLSWYLRAGGEVVVAGAPLCSSGPDSSIRDSIDFFKVSAYTTYHSALLRCEHGADTDTTPAVAEMHVVNLWTYILNETVSNRSLSWLQFRKLVEYLLCLNGAHAPSMDGRLERFNSLMAICMKSYSIIDELPIRDLAHYQSLQDKCISAWHDTSRAATNNSVTALQMLEERYDAMQMEFVQTRHGPRTLEFRDLARCVALLRAERRAVQLLEFAKLAVRVPHLIHRLMEAFDQLVYAAPRIFVNRS